MRGNRKRDTGPEIRLRRLLHAAGLRYRVDEPIQLHDGRPIRPDIVFRGTKVAVFVHGCFWHHCVEHGTTPAGANADYWSKKLQRNVDRDRVQAEKLSSVGWLVVTVWEHDDPVVAAREIEMRVRAR
jgi:DNA mismatch endonuclease (patch repair protein)